MKRVLIVDDAQFIRGTLKLMLEKKWVRSSRRSGRWI